MPFKEVYKLFCSSWFSIDPILSILCNHANIKTRNFSSNNVLNSEISNRAEKGKVAYGYLRVPHRAESPAVDLWSSSWY